MTDVIGRVAELTGPRRFTIRETTFAPPDPGRVLVRVRHVGLCATDLPEWLTGPAGGQPVRLGHEPVGTVHAVGAGVDGLEPGQVVTGRLTPSFADFVYAQPEDVVAVPASLDASLALGEPLGCVLDGFRRCQPPAGVSTAVVGLGFMGLVMTRLLALSPLATLLAVDPRPDARAVAGELGATHLLSPDECEPWSDTLDLVVEASGTQPGLDLASRLTGVDATLAILGYHQAPDRTVDMQAWNWKALTVVNAHIRDPHRLADATRSGLRLAAAGQLPLDRLLTHRFPLESINEAYAALADKPPGFVKAVVDL